MVNLPDKRVKFLSKTVIGVFGGKIIKPLCNLFLKLLNKYSGIGVGTIVRVRFGGEPKGRIYISIGYNTIDGRVN